MRRSCRKADRVIGQSDGGLVSSSRSVSSGALLGPWVAQNAFTFTRAHSTVALRVGSSADRVLIEVEDECGGLPDGNGQALFRPFEERSADRTGSGLGLAVKRCALKPTMVESTHATCLTGDAS